MNNRHDISANLRYFCTKVIGRKKNSIHALVNKYPILGKNQHSFCRENTYLRSLLDFFIGVGSRMNGTITMEYLEFRRAFDEVPY